MSQSPRTGRLTFCVLVFVAVYPLVTGLSYPMQETAQEWAIWQRHLVVVPAVVVAMVFVIVPLIQRLLVHPSPDGRSPHARGGR